ncbi:MAG: DEAD/DEAH box helicase, partial [Pedobacter sp.]
MLKTALKHQHCVITSGTGSGKSLTYMATIFNDLLKNPPTEPGIRAIIVYPMNALINSQHEEIKRYAKQYTEQTGSPFPINFAQYTGQEKADDKESIRKELNLQIPTQVILTLVPEDKSLKNPTFKDICNTLKGTLLFGNQQLGNRIDNFVTGAMQVPNFLNYLKDNVLIVTPGDRGDIIIAALQANQSSSYPKIAGIVLTAG